jgi:hypothetical protein
MEFCVLLALLLMSGECFPAQPGKSSVSFGPKGAPQAIRAGTVEDFNVEK